MLGYPYRFSWTKEVEDEFEKIFKKELKVLQGMGRFAFKLQYYPRIENELAGSLSKYAKNVKGNIPFKKIREIAWEGVVREETSKKKKRTETQ